MPKAYYDCLIMEEEHTMWCVEAACWQQAAHHTEQAKTTTKYVTTEIYAVDIYILLPFPQLMI